MYPSPPLCNSITIQPREENYDNALIDTNLVSNTKGRGKGGRCSHFLGQKYNFSMLPCATYLLHVLYPTKIPGFSVFTMFQCGML